MGVNPKKIELIRQVWAKGNRVARPAVFFDRDGVVIRQRNVVSEEKHMRPLAGAAAGLRSLQECGFLLIIITNQPSIEKGMVTEARARRLNEYLYQELKKKRVTFDASYTCPHRFGTECTCRKPGLELIRAAQKDFKIDMKQSWLIGDTTRDMETGRRAKLKTILVKTGDGGKDKRFFKTRGDIETRNLRLAAQAIAKKKGRL
ncbi:MAG: HAD-IIIA family hydrolase [Patescibacteria group bacterium]